MTKQSASIFTSFKDVGLLVMLLAGTLSLIGAVSWVSGFEESSVVLLKSSVHFLWPLIGLIGFRFWQSGKASRTGLESLSTPLAPKNSRAMGMGLVMLGAVLPLGEGITYAVLLYLIGLLVREGARGRGVSTPSLLIGVWRGWGLWLLAGAVAWGVGEFGWLRPKELGRVLPLLAMPVVAWVSIQVTGLWRKRAAVTFLGVLGLSSVLALIQYGFLSGAESEWLDWVGKFSSRSQMRAPGQGDRLVAGGFFFHRLKMAHVLVIGICVMVARQFTASMTRRWRVLEVALLLLFLSALFFTYTRAALIGVVASGVVLMWFGSWRRRTVLVGTALLILSLASLDVHVRTRLLSIGQAAASAERSLIWSKAVTIISEHPVGIGLGNYPSIIRDHYEGVPGAEMLPRTYAHNLLLSAWAETGYLGVLGYLWGWLAIAVYCYRRLMASRDPRGDEWVYVATLMVLIAFWMVGLTHDVLYHKPVALTFASFIGLVGGSAVGKVKSAS